MRAFKVGDRVRIMLDNKPYSFKGDTGIVDEDDSDCPYVLLDNAQGREFLRPAVGVDEMELITSTQLTKAEYLAFIEKTFAEMTTLIKAKNSDYTAGSDDPFANFRQSVDYGVDPLSGLMVRVGDKLQRIKSFTKAGKLEVANEGVEDAFKDLIGYSLIALGMLRERKPD